MLKLKVLVLFLGVFILNCTGLYAQFESVLTDMENVFEEVEDIRVISLTGTANELRTTPAAMHVITKEDIKNSGATNIPELLRSVPGIQVGAVTANSWDVGLRGSTGRYNDSVQVLVDGRSIYNVFFSGVYWGSLNLVLEDIERIEVIRGPGSTIWGSNAINGVINIVTKSSVNTASTLFQGIVGSEEKELALRFGKALSESVSFRIYGNYFDRDGFVDEEGEDLDDSLEVNNLGTRFDYNKDDISMTLTLEAYDNEEVNIGVGVDPEVILGNTGKENIEEISGGAVLYKVKKEFSEASALEFKTFYNFHELDNTLVFSEQNTAFAELRHNFKINDNQDFLWGISYKRSKEEAKDFVPGSIFFDPLERTFKTLSVFFQDTITFSEDLFFILGAKYDDSELIGGNFQPSARLSYTFNDRVVLWSAYSESVRHPSRVEYDVNLPVMYFPLPDGSLMPVYLSGGGEDNIEEEVLKATEAGLRVDFSDSFSMDLALFYNKFENLIITNAAILSLVNDKNGVVESKGGELVFNYSPSNRLNLTASAEYVDYENNEDEEIFATLLARVSLTDSFNINMEAYYYDERKTFGIDSFVKLDLGLIYKVSDNMEFSLWGLNLADDEVEQQYDERIHRRQEAVERSVYLKIKYML